MKRSREDVQKRQKELLQLFKTHETLQIHEISEALSVSPVTIRRDLISLENQKLIERVHGGAKMIASGIPTIPDITARDHVQMVEKQQIAEYVSTLVTDKETIFINSGSTTFQVIKELVDRPVRIITNNARALELFQDAKAELIMTGGEYFAHNCSFLGELSCQLLYQVHADICILGVNGINAQTGVTTYAYQETLLNKTMLTQCSGKRIVVADGTKIGKTFSFTSTSLDQIDLLITDASANPAELQKIREQNVEVVIVDK